MYDEVNLAAALRSPNHAIAHECRKRVQELLIEANRATDQYQTGTFDHWPNELCSSFDQSGIVFASIQPTAVDHVNLAGRIARLVRRQISGKIRDFICLTQTPHRLSANKLAAHLRFLRPEAVACGRIRSSSDGVCTVPGQIALQRIPCPTKSAATDFVSPMTAALVRE